jgi:hypothetical protein
MVAKMSCLNRQILLRSLDDRLVSRSACHETKPKQLNPHFWIEIPQTTRGNSHVSSVENDEHLCQGMHTCSDRDRATALDSNRLPHVTPEPSPRVVSQTQSCLVYQQHPWIIYALYLTMSISKPLSLRGISAGSALRNAAGASMNVLSAFAEAKL